MQRTVVIGTVLFRMVRRRERRHLVSVPGILEEEMLDLLRDLTNDQCVNLAVSLDGSGKATDLLRRQERAPFVHELREHAPRAAFLDLAQPSEHGEFVVGHAHVRLHQRGDMRTIGSDVRREHLPRPPARTSQ